MMKEFIVGFVHCVCTFLNTHYNTTDFSRISLLLNMVLFIRMSLWLYFMHQNVQF